MRVETINGVGVDVIAEAERHIGFILSAGKESRFAGQQHIFYQLYKRPLISKASIPCLTLQFDTRKLYLLSKLTRHRLGSVENSYQVAATTYLPPGPVQQIRLRRRLLRGQGIIIRSRHHEHYHPSTAKDGPKHEP